MLEGYNQRLIEEVAQRTSELHQKNVELSFKEQHLLVLLAAAPVGMLELDESDRCLYINANGSALTACSVEQAMGRHMLDFVHLDDRDKLQQIWPDHLD